MTLKNDLIRDTLLCIEKLCENYTNSTNNKFYSKRVHWKHIYEDEYLTAKYLIDDIKYCILKLQEANLIEADVFKGGGGITFIDIKNLTWQGHELLNNIRNDDIWKTAKTKLGDISKISFSALSSIMTEFAIIYGKQKLGLV